MLNNFIKSAAVGALLFAVPSAHAAVTVVVGPGANQSSATFVPAMAGSNTALFNFNGFGSNGSISGLAAQLSLTLTGVVGNSYQFSYSLANTSGGPIDASRLTIFGFNANPNFSSVSGLSGPFNVVALNGQQPNGLTNLEVCFKDSGNTNNCTGASQGVDQGSSVNGTFNLNFASEQQQLVLSDFSVRYQGIESTTLGIRDGSANGTPFGLVPEPATWAMMILGFGLIGGALRSRKVQAARVTYA
ncbi:MAG: cistern family PEP-CTERM protein [Sphingopyxis sp.]|nr:cistern family PEP-CTERM protein [Sphingopyxis sp.]